MTPGTEMLSFGCHGGDGGDRLLFFILRQTSEVPPVCLVAASFAEWQLPRRGEQLVGGPRLFLTQLDDFPTSKWCPGIFCPEPPEGSLCSTMGFFFFLMENSKILSIYLKRSQRVFEI